MSDTALHPCLMLTMGVGIFALAPFAGPSIGPIVAGFIQVSGTVSHLPRPISRR